MLVDTAFQIPDGKQLGEWVGLAKLDREGKPRKVVKCSCAVVSLEMSLSCLSSKF